MSYLVMWPNEFELMRDRDELIDYAKRIEAEALQLQQDLSIARGPVRNSIENAIRQQVKEHRRVQAEIKEIDKLLGSEQ